MHGVFSPASKRPRISLGARVGHSALILCVVFCTAMFGVVTRSGGPLASFWPANALLLGLFVRDPRKAAPTGWLSAFVALVAADLLSGHAITMAIWLSLANLTGAVVGFILFQRLAEEDRRFRRPESILHLFLICLVGSLASALVGAATFHILLGNDLLTGIRYWFTTELADGLIVLPVVLTAPAWPYEISRQRRIGDWNWGGIQRHFPALALGASILLASIVGGPGAIVIPVPALLWCALHYNLFQTTILTLLFSFWQIYTAAAANFALSNPADDVRLRMSIRLGIALLALGPLTVASVNVARNELLQNLDYAASHDFLTKALSRGAFMKLGSSLLAPSPYETLITAVLMLDIDFFKEINDRHGHSAGDSVLTDFAQIVKDTLRAGDLFGRLGGEEFGVILPGITLSEAAEIAERIRLKIETTPIRIDENTALAITVSIGLAYLKDQLSQPLESILVLSDKALYRAKMSGRNKVVYAENLPA